MRLSLILTVCVMSSRLLGDLQAADDLDLPTETRAVVQDAQSKPIDWKQRSGEVQQLIAPPKLDFEKVGYQIGDVNALKALLGQSNSLPIFSATGTQGSERAFGFGSETLTWSGVKWESKADAPAASGTIEQVSHQEFPGLSQDLSVGTGLPTPEQIFDVPVDPLVRDYTAAPRRWTDLLPDSLWKEYADWFIAGSSVGPSDWNWGGVSWKEIPIRKPSTRPPSFPARHH
ncbi:MAG: hypothetical protein JWM11_5619 [Planctomycetaceae bacterium]|nr:hypothetical protein [Planctomycetaceae bacterium]